MNKNKIIKQLSNAGVVNNIANRFFQTALILGPLIALIADASQIQTSIFSQERIELYVIFVQGCFASLIFALGEPTNKNWDTIDLQDKIKKSSYYTTNNIEHEKLGEKIDFLKSYFSKYWSYLWGTWALFYVMMFIISYNKLYFDIPEKNQIPVIKVSQVVLDMVKNIITYLNSFFILCLYFTLVHKFDSHKAKRDSSIDFHKYSKRALFLFLILIISEIVIYLTLDSQDMWSVHNIQIVKHSFQVLNGIIACICFAMLLSRLIGSFTTVLPYKSILLPFLFLYCSIQPLYFMVNAISEEKNAFKDTVSLIVLLIALLGKYLLYVSITWLFETKRILFHFLETHQLRNEIKKEIDLFDDIWNEDSKIE